MVFLKPSATCASAASQLAAWPSIMGASNRPSRPIVSASAEPLAHNRPKLAGCSGSPRTVTAPAASLSAMTPQPTPQYGQLVFTGTGDHPYSAGTAAAVRMQSQTVLFST